ncbi:hypothetical protein BC940DRAFT_324062 [Gongronella butleri]|nr:hypothetical protein BC940DRAFT_324062 [Gongronella butleri]
MLHLARNGASNAILQVPDSVLGLIFSQLHWYELLTEVRRVNRAFHRVATPLAASGMTIHIHDLDCLRFMAIACKSMTKMLYDAQSLSIDARDWHLYYVDNTALESDMQVVSLLSRWLVNVRTCAVHLPISLDSDNTADRVRKELLAQLYVMPSLQSFASQQFPISRAACMTLLPEQLTRVDLKLHGPGRSMKTLAALLEHLPLLTHASIGPLDRTAMNEYQSLFDWVSKDMDKRNRQYKQVQELRVAFHLSDAQLQDRNALFVYFFFTLPQVALLELRINDDGMRTWNKRLPPPCFFTPPASVMKRIERLPSRLIISDAEEHPGAVSESSTQMDDLYGDASSAHRPPLIECVARRASKVKALLAWMQCPPLSGASTLVVRHAGDLDRHSTTLSLATLTAQWPTLQRLYLVSMPLCWQNYMEIDEISANRGGNNLTQPSPPYKLLRLVAAHCVFTSRAVIERIATQCPQLDYLKLDACVFRSNGLISHDSRRPINNIWLLKLQHVLKKEAHAAWMPIPVPNLTMAIAPPERVLYLVLQEQSSVANDNVQAYLGQFKVDIDSPPVTKKLGPNETNWLLRQIHYAHEASIADQNYKLTVPFFPTATHAYAWTCLVESAIVIITCISVKPGTSIFAKNQLI